MGKVNIDEEHDPKTAFFWAMFADEIGKQKEHCPRVTLYENRKGEFFAVQESPNVNMEPTGFTLVKNPRAWLYEQAKRLNMPSPAA